MNKYKKPIYEDADLGENPFVDTLVVDVNEMEFKGQYKRLKNGDLVPLVRDVESEVSCRVYTTAAKRKKMNELGNAATRLLLWIIYEVEGGKDYLWLNKVRYMEESGISSAKTFYSAVNDLISKKFIFRTLVGGVYWINPAFFFSGNRILKFPDNLKYRK